MSERLEDWFSSMVEDAASDLDCEANCNAHPEYSGWADTLRWAGIPWPKLPDPGIRGLTFVSLCEIDDEVDPEGLLEGLDPAGRLVIKLQESFGFTMEVEDEGGSSTSNDGELHGSAVLLWEGDLDGLLVALGLDEPTASAREAEEAQDREAASRAASLDALRRAMAACAMILDEDGVTLLWREVVTVQPVMES